MALSGINHRNFLGWLAVCQLDTIWSHLMLNWKKKCLHQIGLWASLLCILYISDRCWGCGDHCGWCHPCSGVYKNKAGQTLGSKTVNSTVELWASVSWINPFLPKFWSWCFISTIETLSGLCWNYFELQLQYSGSNSSVWMMEKYNKIPGHCGCRRSAGRLAEKTCGQQVPLSEDRLFQWRWPLCVPA